MTVENKATDRNTGSTGTTAEATSKVDQPHNQYGHPAQVVTDPDLSKHEKAAALDSLEQDARQLAVASGEGMEGGEATNLREVLLARNALNSPSSEAAFETVLQTFESKLSETQGTDAHIVISRAIDGIKAARKAIEQLAETPEPPVGAPKPGSEQELREELAKEKLDP